MNTYTYDEIQIGQEESFHAAITDEDMAAFRKITGDFNSLHCDDAYARQRGYDRRVVYGMLTASYLSALAGMYLPGKHCLIHQVEVKFAKVHYPGSGTLAVYGKCTEKQDTFRRIVLKVRVTNEAGETILRGQMKIGVAE